MNIWPVLIAGGVAVAGIAALTMTDKKLLTPVTSAEPLREDTRGYRNNNPGNIRYSPNNKWQGQTGQDAAGFVVFDTMSNGVRAMNKILDSYARQGITTLKDILYRWAPPIENNTAQYLAHIIKVTGWAENRVISQADRPQLLSMLILHENGYQKLSLSFIKSAATA